MISFKSQFSQFYNGNGFFERYTPNYPHINTTIFVEPYIQEGFPHYAIDNYRNNGAIGYNCSVLFYTQPSWGQFFEQRMGRDKVKCITYAIEPEYHKDYECDYEYEVGFIGELTDPTGTRQRLLDALRRNFKCFIEYGVPMDKIGEKLSQCKVLFNHIRCEEVNIRFFESMYYGAQVTSYSPALHLLAEEEKHYLSFKSEQQAIDQIKYLLENDEKRAEMKLQARDIILQRHTYKKRTEELVSML